MRSLALSSAASCWSHFGAPNGGFDETKSQWCYHLRAPGAIIDVYDWKLESWSIEVYEQSNDEGKAQRIGTQFAHLLAKESNKHSAVIAKAAREATGYIFQNPYLLYYETGDELLARAVEGSIGDRIFCCRAAFFMFISAFEGLLNLIYEMYLKPELRDERIRERLGREQIDIKVRLAPVYCECVSKDRIDHESDAFKRFHSVANSRNDFIHANITTPMKRPVVIEDRCTFIVEPATRDKQGLPRSVGDLAPSDIETVKKAIDALVTQLLGSMKPRYRREFSGVLDH